MPIVKSSLARTLTTSLFIASASLLGGCGSEPVDDDEVSPVAEPEADPTGTTHEAICVTDQKYKYRGYVAGYKTWSIDCTGVGYQIDPCRGDHYAYRRNVTVGYGSSGYFIRSAHGWYRTNRCS